MAGAAPPRMTEEEEEVTKVLRQQMVQTEFIMPFNFYPLRSVLRVAGVRRVERTGRTSGELWRATLPAANELEGYAIAPLVYRPGRHEFIPWHHSPVRNANVHADGKMVKADFFDESEQVPEVWALRIVTSTTKATVQYTFVDNRPSNKIPAQEFQFIAIMRLSPPHTVESRYTQIRAILKRNTAAGLEALQTAGDANDDDDDDVEVIGHREHVMVKPKDDVTYMPIEVPVRSVRCKHHQCFDLNVALLRLATQRRDVLGVRCPLCSASFNFVLDLVVDVTFQNFMRDLQERKLQSQHEKRDYKVPVAMYHKYGFPTAPVPTTRVCYHVKGEQLVEDTGKRHSGLVACRILAGALGAKMYMRLRKDTMVIDKQLEAVPGEWKVFKGVDTPFFVPKKGTDWHKRARTVNSTSVASAVAPIAGVKRGYGAL